MLMCLEIEQICIIIGNLTMSSIRLEILFSIDYCHDYYTAVCRISCRCLMDFYRGDKELDRTGWSGY